MKLSAALSIMSDLRVAISVAWLPTLKAIFNKPSLIFRPSAVSCIFMSHVWMAFSDGVDENGRHAKKGLITPNAFGIVLDIGAGHGHTIDYLDRERVQRYIALEPNTLMHPHIRRRANASGYMESDGSLTILALGLGDTSAILSELGDDKPSVDIIISILTMCTVPDPERSMARAVRDILKPGGQLLFGEHVLSPRRDVAWWQRFWTPIWSVAFDGCKLDRPIDVWIDRIVDVNQNGETVSMWTTRKTWDRGDSEEDLFRHRLGRFVKHSEM